jgi:hypothetical protein
MPGTRLDGSCHEVSDGRTTQQDDNLGSAGFGGKCQIDVVFQVWSTTTQSRKMDVDCVCCARAETVFQPQAHGSLVGLLSSTGAGRGCACRAWACARTFHVVLGPAPRLRRAAEATTEMVGIAPKKKEMLPMANRSKNIFKYFFLPPQGLASQYTDTVFSVGGQPV